MTEVDLPASILLGRPDPNRLADQAATDEVAPSLPLDGAMDGDDAHRIIWAIDDLRQRLGKGADTGLVALRRYAIVQRLMGPLVVVGGAEAVEGDLGGGEIGELALGEDFSRDGAVKALDLALGLRMRDPSMPRLDAEAHPPRFQPRQSDLPGWGPGRAVVTEDGAWQPVATKDGRQLVVYRL